MNPRARTHERPHTHTFINNRVRVSATNPFVCVYTWRYTRTQTHAHIFTHTNVVQTILIKTTQNHTQLIKGMNAHTHTRNGIHTCHTHMRARTCIQNRLGGNCAQMETY
eukprot:GDKI01006706.1.p1 GENE.GDKI01006706.1~~GDKI01006706.1.p1  ORF type:complete len:109 (-),score=32.28 GDKI01006706.1:28-354(-)